jgi:hypothetical protein
VPSAAGTPNPLPTPCRASLDVHCVVVDYGSRKHPKVKGWPRLSAGICTSSRPAASRLNQVVLESVGARRSHAGRMQVLRGHLPRPCSSGLRPSIAPMFSRPPLRSGQQPLSAPRPSLSALRIPARRRAQVRQRPKSLSHVVEFAQRGVELVRLGGPLTLLLRSAPVTAAPIHDDQQDGDDRERDEAGQHGKSMLDQAPQL